MMQEIIDRSKRILAENAALTEAFLAPLYKGNNGCDGAVYASAHYSLMAGGKRVRPTLTLEFCRLFGGEPQAALPFAAAVEMIHTFSLIHDDLPCMDNDDMRRGRPTNHKVYGEAIALLAGDALALDAFAVAAENTAVDPEARATAVSLLSRAAGSLGMCRGQTVDIYGETHDLIEEELLFLHAHKTGALIRVAAQLGALAAGYRPGTCQEQAAVAYAERIGLAFQVVDDVLDATATAEQLGKSVGGDAIHHKNTFLTFYSVEEAMDYARRLTDEAVEAIRAYPGSHRLMDLAGYLAVRDM